MTNSEEPKLPRKSIADQFHYDCKRMNDINHRRNQDIKNNSNYILQEQDSEAQINPDYISP